ncbi:MAG: T9SS type A sorting domain-containing protein [Lewinellaceae bacterium]|nr:T9SS type A sorting domain-containing protein [Lewinellaceae bacterium]
MIRLLSTLLAVFTASILQAQVSCEPIFPNVDDDVTIYFNATEGNGALVGINPVFAHMGVITNLSTSSSDWKHVTTTWGVNDPVGAMTLVSPNLWKKTFNIRTFFGVPANETVLKLAFVYRNTTGTIVGRASDGADIFYPVYPDNGNLITTFVAPAASSFLSSTGTPIAVKAASSQVADLKLLDNGTLVASANGKLLETTFNAGNTGSHLVQFIADAGAEADTSTFTYFIPGPIVNQDPPAGTEQGIQYLSSTAVRLSLFAPNKGVVNIIGDFNDWELNSDYQMKRSLDGNTWWIDIAGLQAGQNYRFQYFVDGSLRIADPLSTLVLDPFNDPYIPTETFPNLPTYPTGKTGGYVSLIIPGQAPFNWQSNNFTRPKKTDLVVYELLLRDFIARHDYQTMLDTLDYLERLGVDAIELMPVNEFGGNISWGYNPVFHKALDKYYGTPEAFKTFIDACHVRGIAVILDVVFNQADGLSPLAQLYWDAANNRPSPDNPWLNPTATHDFSVFNDFNHESAATKAYVKNCLGYWLGEYRVDGFRFDLSKGFTQNNTLGNVGLWNMYDPSRITILKNYADFVWSNAADAYVILEHFADNNEEKELAAYGMMLWGNMHSAYKEVALGYFTGVNQDLRWVDYKQRGWTVPHAIGYMESHDEERIVYDCKLYGNTVSAAYDVKTLPIALRRMELLANLFYTVPGPKMLWQFGELGYDYSINTCTNGSVNNNCRLDPKPIRWDFPQDPFRKRLFDVTAALIHLRTEYDVFETTNYNADIGAGKIRKIWLSSPDMNVFVIANVAATTEPAQLYLDPTQGWWYEYYTGDSILSNGVPIPVTLQPGEYRLYLDKYVALPPGLNPTPAHEISGNLSDLSVFPNPIGNQVLAQYFLERPGDVRVEVYDLNGRLIDTTSLPSQDAGEHFWEADCNAWIPGVYLLLLRDEQGATLVKKIVKQ